MFCPSCGSQVPDESKFCPSCGASFNSAAAQSAATPQPTEAPVPGAAPVPAPPVPGTAPSGAAAPEMKWYKFIIWVQLFLSALSLVGTGIMLLTGTHYGDAKALVYMVYGGLQAADIIFAIVFIALAVCCIIVRMNLAKFKKGAPTQYLILLGANIAAQLVYALALAAITQINVFQAMDSSAVVQIITSVVMIILSKIYFDKREHLFTN